MENEKESFGKWQVAKGWFDRAYDSHLRKYHGWDQHFYRFCVRAMVILIILSVGIPAAWVGRSSYRRYAEKHDAEQAQSFLAVGDYRNASLSAYAALRYNSNNVAACRVMARMASLDHSPKVLFWQSRIVAAEPTVANKLDLASEGLVYQAPPFPLTTKTLAELPASATNTAGCHVVRAALALRLKHFPEAESEFAVAVKLDPTNQAYAFNLAVLRTKASDEALRKEALVTLESLSTNATYGVAALRILVQDRLDNGDLPAAEHFSMELLTQPGTTMADQLQNLSILKRQSSEHLSVRLRAVQKTATNAVAAAQLSEWMQANGMVMENVRWLTKLPADVRNRQPVRAALAQDYLQSENWAALRDYAAQGNWEDMEYLRLALVSYALTKLGDSDMAGNNWDSAVTEASRRLESLTKLYHLVKGWGIQNMEEDLLVRITAEYPQQGWARQELANLYITEGKTAALHDLAEQLSVRFPKELEWENQQMITALLLKTNLPETFQLAADAYTQHPTNQNETATYAYALHLQGQDQQGLALLMKLSPAQIEQPYVAMFYGILLAANGRPNEAVTWLQLAQKKIHLLPEEKQLVTAALGTASPQH